MTCSHEFTPSPDDNDYGGSALSIDNDGNVCCSLCDAKWFKGLQKNQKVNT